MVMEKRSELSVDQVQVKPFFLSQSSSWSVPEEDFFFFRSSINSPAESQSLSSTPELEWTESEAFGFVALRPGGEPWCEEPVKEPRHDGWSEAGFGRGPVAVGGRTVEDGHHAEAKCHFQPPPTPPHSLHLGDSSTSPLSTRSSDTSMSHFCVFTEKKNL